ncbi:hypothetical protein BH11PLA1_BH11PLA1_10240 [soil metagenome]
MIPAALNLPYKIERELGRGGMGVVYLAHDPRLNRQVAIKTLENQGVRDDAERHRIAQRFRREAQLLAQLNHPFIASIYDIAEADGAVCLVMEYVDGPTLLDTLAEAPQGVGVGAALGLALQIAEALAAAHERQIIHGDLKPANVKLTPKGDVKLLDFGLARSAPRSAAMLAPLPDDVPTSSFTASDIDSLMSGTVGYMSPEMARGGEVGPAADVFALGCVVYELITGARAFAGKTAGAVMAAALFQPVDDALLNAAGTPVGISGLIVRCLAKESGDRPASGKEFARLMREQVAQCGLHVPGMPVETAPSRLGAAASQNSAAQGPSSASGPKSAPASQSLDAERDSTPDADADGVAADRKSTAPQTPRSRTRRATDAASDSTLPAPSAPPAPLSPEPGDSVPLSDLAKGAAAPARFFSQLPREQRRTLTLLAAFAGEFSSAAAHALLNAAAAGTSAAPAGAAAVAAPTAAPAAALARLTDWGLLTRTAAGEGEPRFRVPPALRAALVQHAAHSEDTTDDTLIAAASRALLRHLAVWAQRIAALLDTPAMARCLREIDAEADTFVGALAWSAATGEGGEDAVRILAALRTYWEMRGRLGYARTALEKALERGHNRLNPETHALGLSTLGTLAFHEGDVLEAVALQRKALTMRRQQGDEPGIAESLLLLADTLVRKERATARTMLEEAIDLGNKLDRRDIVARGCLGLSLVSLHAASIIEAQRALLTAAVPRPGSGNAGTSVYSPRLDADIQRLWATLKLFQGDAEEAERLVRASLELSRAVGDEPGLGADLCLLAKVLLHKKEPAPAETALEEGLETLRRVRDKVQLLIGIGVRAHLLSALRRHNEALTTWLAAERMRAERMFPISPVEQELARSWHVQTWKALIENDPKGIEKVEKAATLVTWNQLIG